MHSPGSSSANASERKRESINNKTKFLVLKGYKEELTADPGISKTEYLQRFHKEHPEYHISYDVFERLTTRTDLELLEKAAKENPSGKRIIYNRKVPEPDELAVALEQYITNSNMKRGGVEYTSWTTTSVLSAAALIQRRMNLTSTSPVAREFASSFVKKHPMLCIKNLPTEKKAKWLTEQICVNTPSVTDHGVRVGVSAERGGYGLFATRDILPNQLITPYLGIQVHRSEALGNLYDRSYVWSNELQDEYFVDAHHATQCGFGGYMNDALDRSENNINATIKLVPDHTTASSSSSSSCSSRSKKSNKQQEIVPWVVSKVKIVNNAEILTSYKYKYWEEGVNYDTLPNPLRRKVMEAYSPRLSGTATSRTFTHPSHYCKKADRVGSEQSLSDISTGGADSAYAVAEIDNESGGSEDRPRSSRARSGGRAAAAGPEKSRKRSLYYESDAEDEDEEEYDPVLKRRAANAEIPLGSTRSGDKMATRKSRSSAQLGKLRP